MTLLDLTVVDRLLEGPVDDNDDFGGVHAGLSRYQRPDVDARDGADALTRVRSLRDVLAAAARLPALRVLGLWAREERLFRLKDSPEGGSGPPPEPLGPRAPPLTLVIHRGTQPHNVAEALAPFAGAPLARVVCGRRVYGAHAQQWSIYSNTTWLNLRF